MTKNIREGWNEIGNNRKEKNSEKKEQWK